MLANEWGVGLGMSFEADDPVQEYPMAYALFREIDGKLVGHFCIDSVDPAGKIAPFLDAEYASLTGASLIDEHRWAEVTFVLVTPTLRGAGLGGLLMKHAKEILLQTKTFVGVVLQCKPSLQAFYSLCGFHAISTPPAVDQTEPEIWMITCG